MCELTSFYFALYVYVCVCLSMCVSVHVHMFVRMEQESVELLGMFKEFMVKYNKVYSGREGEWHTHEQTESKTYRSRSYHRPLCKSNSLWIQILIPDQWTNI